MSKRKPTPAPEPESAAPEPTAPPEAETPPATAALEAERDEWRDRCLRTAAELENYRKRMQRELGQAREQGVADLAASLLDVLDNLERALAAVPETERHGALGQGVSMVLEQVRSVLAAQGVSAIEAAGRPFDPHRHEAILEVEHADAPPGTVLQEARKGYLLGERLLRATQVLVAKAAAAAPAAEASPADPEPPEPDPADDAPSEEA